MQNTTGVAWCVCGRASDRDAFEPCQSGLVGEDEAVAWLKENHGRMLAEHGYREFYIDREDNENPADLWAEAREDGLRFTLASGVEVSV